MKDQVTQLEERWAQFRKKLSASIEDNKRAIRRQKEFDQEHQKICAVLQTVLRGTDSTSLDQTDMAVNLERVEVGICFNFACIFNCRFLVRFSETRTHRCGNSFQNFIPVFNTHATFPAETKVSGKRKKFRNSFCFSETKFASARNDACAQRKTQCFLVCGDLHIVRQRRGCPEGLLIGIRMGIIFNFDLAFSCKWIEYLFLLCVLRRISRRTTKATVKISTLFSVSRKISIRMRARAAGTGHVLMTTCRACDNSGAPC